MLQPDSGIYSIKRYKEEDFYGGRKCVLIQTIMILVILAVGAIYDLRDHRIPNWWVLGMAGIGLGVLWWLDLGDGFLFRCLAVIVVCFPLFYCRMMGAGDIKLMALICGFLGFVSGGVSILVGFLIGAVMALVKLLVQRSLFRRLHYLYAYFKRMILTKEIVAYHSSARDGYEHTIPFALCLFLGTLLSTVFMKN